ncbi:MAG TPA: ATP-binding protein [Solirubrobacterales bacterium]|nr:ATP-binding protein [Solirubrobacterales bacterium]
MEFIGRDAEMAALQAEFAQVEEGGGRFAWVRGRRRVGKSRLVQEFCDRSDAPYAFFQAQRRGERKSIALFADAVARSTLPAAPAFAGTSFDSWPIAIRAAAQGIDPARPAILVIDELPYLAEFDPGFSADLQHAWDRVLEKAPLLLICVGSDVRMMESLLGARAPLFGRTTLNMRVDPLDPSEVADLTAAPDAAATLDRYLIVGGFPQLASSWRKGVGKRAFLRETLAHDQAPLAATAQQIMLSEFPRELQARDVIEAIGHGESAYSRIRARSGVKGNTLNDALEMLVEQKLLVTRELPYAVPPGRKAPRYTVADPYLRFWLRFVGPHLDELSRGRSDLVIERIERDWAVYRGRAIEPLVRAALERLLDEPSLSGSLGGARHVGAWWRRDHSVEVDLVGGDRPEPKQIGFVGSVKWRDREPFSTADLRELEASRAHVPGAEGAKLVAVSRSGFEGGLEVDASFGPDELLAAW